MSDTFSLYEAKARLSALIRRVREGRSITITVHGKPVAELRPFPRSATPPTLEQRLAVLDEAGLVRPALREPADPTVLQVGAKKPGALQRFLEERE